MLDDLLIRKDVQKMFNDICNSECYFNKKINKSIEYQSYTDIEQIVFLFYDALFKFKLIIGNTEYFPEYLEQIDKLIRKIDNFKDISSGISRIISRICCDMLGEKDINNSFTKEKVLSYIYNVYVKNGYYIHGYSSVYTGVIKEEGFVTEIYNNLYPNFVKMQKILDKHNCGCILDKDFSSREISLTSNFVKGCYYSINSPMYFYKLLCKNGYATSKKEVECYFKNDYKGCFNNLNKLCNKLKFNDKEKSLFIETFNSEWKLLKKEKSKISLMLIPRRLVTNEKINYMELVSDDIPLGVAVDKLLNSSEDVKYLGCFDPRSITFVELDFYKVLKNNGVGDSICDKTAEIEFDEYAFSNDYGKVSILLLLGSLAVSLGVIITLINLWRV